MRHAPDHLFERPMDISSSPSEKAPKLDDCQEIKISGLTACDREFLKQCFSAISVEIENKLTPVKQKLSALEKEHTHLLLRLDELQLAYKGGTDPAIQRKRYAIEEVFRTSTSRQNFGDLHDSTSQCQAQQPNTHKDGVSNMYLQKLGQLLKSKLDKANLAHPTGSSASSPLDYNESLDVSKSQRQVPHPSADHDDNSASLLVDVPKACLQEFGRRFESGQDEMKPAHQAGVHSLAQRETDEIISVSQIQVTPPPGGLGALHDATCLSQAKQHNTDNDDDPAHCLIGEAFESRFGMDVALGNSIASFAGNLDGLHDLKAQSQPSYLNTNAEEIPTTFLARDSCLHQLGQRFESRFEKLQQSNRSEMAIASQRRKDETEEASLPTPTISCFHGTESQSQAWQTSAGEDENFASYLFSESDEVELTHHPGMADPLIQCTKDQIGTSANASHVSFRHSNANNFDNSMLVLVGESKTYPQQLESDQSEGCLKGQERKTSQSSQRPRSRKRQRQGKSKGMTMMIANIPCRVTHADVVEAINSTGFDGTKYQLYLPSRYGQPHSNLGYCFVNFFREADASSFALAFEGYHFISRGSTKTCTVKVANHQGHFKG